MSVKTQPIAHPEYGKCILMENGAVELMATLDYGPRIIHFALAGGKNMLLFDKDHLLTGSGEDFDKAYYPGAKFYLRGGHRLWRSPEHDPETSYPDNDPVEYTVDGSTVTLHCAKQIHNNVQYRFEIAMDATAPNVSIAHYITNVSDTAMIFAPWTITVMDQGGVEIVPMNTTSTGLLQNRTISVWPYTNLACKRGTFMERYFLLRQNPDIQRAYKLGFDNEAGWAGYVNHGALFVKHYTHVPGGSYPDNGCSYETYTNNVILEMETIGQLLKYAPGQTAEHTEHWSLKPIADAPDFADEQSVASFVAEYVGYPNRT